MLVSRMQAGSVDKSPIRKLVLTCLEDIHFLTNKNRPMVALMDKDWGLERMGVSTHVKPCLRLNPGHAAFHVWIRQVSVDHV
jgi:hypothetical protein